MKNKNISLVITDIDIRTVIAVGDNFNDLAMVKNVGIGIGIGFVYALENLIELKVE